MTASEIELELPVASVRSRVRLPLLLSDGSRVAAEAYTFEGLVDGLEHLAVGLGPRVAHRNPLVRPHSQCLTGDVLGSARCDCGAQLAEALDRIADVGGYLLYLRQEGRGIGLYNKLDAYALQEKGLDTFEANRLLGFSDDDRSYAVVAQMLLALGVGRLDLLTNSPDKAAQIRGYGLAVDRVLTTGVHCGPDNIDYLQAKRRRAGHHLDQLPR